RECNRASPQRNSAGVQRKKAVEPCDSSENGSPEIDAKFVLAVRIGHMRDHALAPLVVIPNARVGREEEGVGGKSEAVFIVNRVSDAARHLAESSPHLVMQDACRPPTLEFPGILSGSHANSASPAVSPVVPY